MSDRAGVDDPFGETRHALKNRVAVIHGWAQLLEREHAKPAPDLARLLDVTRRLQSAVYDLSTDIERRLGPRNGAPPDA